MKAEYPAAFAQFYSAYPRHTAKKAAFRAWLAVARKVETTAIHHALEEQIALWTKEGRKTSYIPYPATWLRATDFDDEFEAREDDLPQIKKHLCQMCLDDHVWLCSEECAHSYELACPEFIARRKQ